MTHVVGIGVGHDAKVDVSRTDACVGENDEKVVSGCRRCIRQAFRTGCGVDLTTDGSAPGFRRR